MLNEHCVLALEQQGTYHDNYIKRQIKNTLARLVINGISCNVYKGTGIYYLYFDELFAYVLMETLFSLQI